MSYRVLTFLTLLSTCATAEADLIALWNFNDENLVVDRQAPGRSATMSTNFEADNVQYFSGSSVNAQDGDPAGQALALQGGAANANNGRFLDFGVSTLGFEDILVSFATRRTGTGFDDNSFQYTLDGIDYTELTTYDPPASFGLLSFDLSSITGLDNNPNAGFRILFDGATSASGNNRIDNLLVSGDVAPVAAVPEPGTLLLMGVAGLGGLVSQRKRFRAVG